MLAGVGGIDHALLVVACDDGVMAQTREHLAILQLTGKPSLTIALTKADRVEAQRVEEVRGDVTAVLAEFGFTDATLFATAATENRDRRTARAFTAAVRPCAPAAPAFSRRSTGPLRLKVPGWW